KSPPLLFDVYVFAEIILRPRFPLPEIVFKNIFNQIVFLKMAKTCAVAKRGNPVRLRLFGKTVYNRAVMAFAAKVEIYFRNLHFPAEDINFRKFLKRNGAQWT